MEQFTKMIRDYFEKGLDIPSYRKEFRHYRSIVKDLFETARAKSEHVDGLKKAAERYSQPVRATSMTEDWCGDWACNMPILTDLFERAGIPFRVFRGSEHAGLKAYYEKSGDDHIPAVSLWDGEGNEIARWIEAPAKVDERKNSWKTDNPQLMELYHKQNTDKEAAKHFAVLYRKFLETMAEWYKEGMWNETTGEIVGKMEKGR